MNREEIEKEFDEKFGNTGIDVLANPIKSFFLDEILPEALRDLLSFDFSSDVKIARGNGEALQKIKKQAKEKYNITL